MEARERVPPVTTIKTGNRRLLKLADYLETVPSKAFDMNTWAEHSEGSPVRCGFIGCAIGWAAHGRLFRGLRSKRIPPDEYGTGPDWRLSFSEDCIEEWGMDHFALSLSKFEYLFVPRTHEHIAATPKQEAKRIREFVKDRV